MATKTRSAPSKAARLAKTLREQYGFDKAHVATSDGGTRYARVGCSQCQAMCVNGVPLHEKGCPNEKFPKDDDDDDDYEA